MNKQARCSICGRFMSNDDVLLGVNDGEDCNGHWAHWSCAVNIGAVIK
jgi:hypothetical protein